MEKFAFIIHPLSIADMEHLSPIMKYIPASIIEAGLKMKNLLRFLILQVSKALMQKQKAGSSVVL